MASTFKGKRLDDVYKTVDRTKFYPIEEAVKAITTASKTNMDQTVELARNLAIEPRHSDHQAPGVLTPPNRADQTQNH